MRVLEAPAVVITLDADGIAETQTPAGAGDLDLDGVSTGTYPYFTDAGLSSTRTEARLSPPRPVSFTTADDESGKTFTVYGTDRAGKLISEVVTGPDTTTASTVKLFASVYRIAVSAALTDAVTVGWTAVSYTKWVYIGNWQNGSNWKFRAFIAPGATATYDVEATSMKLNSSVDYTGGDETDDTVPILSAQTTNVTSDNDTAWVAVRLKVTAQTGKVTLRIIPSQVTY